MPPLSRVPRRRSSLSRLRFSSGTWRRKSNSGFLLHRRGAARPKTVDYTLKNYIAAEEIDPSWSKLGEELDRAVAESSGHAFVPSKALIDKIQ